MTIPPGADGRFGEQRVVRPGAGLGQRFVHSLLGAPDPANYLHHRYLRQALESIPALSPRRILDAGSGPGDHTIWLARKFPEAQVLARDILDEKLTSLAISASRLGLKNVSVERADLRHMTEDSEFDLIVSIDVLEHIPEQAEVLRRLRRSLVAGGAAYFHVPTRRPRPVPFNSFLGEFLAWGEIEHTAEELSADQFLAAVQSAGFLPTGSWRTFGYWTGELATSLFSLPYKNTAANRVAQLALSPICRALALADLRSWESTRYAVAVLATR